MSRLYCGTSGWNYPHWRDLFYPKGIPQSKWLSYYCELFDTVEINNSFYRLPSEETFKKWHDESSEGFTFAVKASRYLTHMKKLKDPEQPLHNVLSHSAALGEKRGPILYQLPPYWHVNLERLESFLKQLPTDLRHVFEFRDDSWHCEEVWSLLAECGAGYCIMDAPGFPLHIRSTSNFSYIRMHSGGIETGGNYTDEHLEMWVRHIENLLKLGDVYIYFNNDYRGFAICNALKLKALTEGLPGV